MKMFNLLWLLAHVHCRLIYLIRHAEKPKLKSTYLSPLGLQRSKSINFKVNSILTQSYRNGKSKRPFLTVLPLAQILGLEIDAECDSRDIDCAIDKIMSARGDVLVCWEHKRLGKIAKRLGFDKKYPKDRFDLVWTIDTWRGTIEETVQDFEPM